MRHVLVIGADSRQSHLLVTLLTANRLDALFEARAEAVLAHVARRHIDLVVVDDDHPESTNRQVCDSLRNNGYLGGIIMLSSRCEELDVVAGLDAGADDYLTKPYTVGELLSRVRSVMRRVDRTCENQPVTTPGGLRLDIATHRIVYGAVEIASSGREYDLLALLIANQLRVVTKEELMTCVWGRDWIGTPMVFPTTLRRVRDKLAAAGVPDRIENVRGIGYRLSLS